MVRNSLANLRPGSRRLSPLALAVPSRTANRCRGAAGRLVNSGDAVGQGSGLRGVGGQPAVAQPGELLVELGFEVAVAAVERGAEMPAWQVRVGMSHLPPGGSSPRSRAPAAARICCWLRRRCPSLPPDYGPSWLAAASMAASTR
jgi:hypothetical protein